MIIAMLCFPTRRSSVLRVGAGDRRGGRGRARDHRRGAAAPAGGARPGPPLAGGAGLRPCEAGREELLRSEEHTSELQSPDQLRCLLMPMKRMTIFVISF